MQEPIEMGNLWDGFAFASLRLRTAALMSGPAFLKRTECSLKGASSFIEILHFSQGALQLLQNPFLARQEDNLLPLKEKTPNSSVVPWSLAVGTMSRQAVWLELVLPAKRKVTCSSLVWKKIRANINCLGQHCNGRGQICGFDDWICYFPILCHHSQGENIKNSSVSYIETQRK